MFFLFSKLRGILKFVGLTGFACCGNLNIKKDILHHKWCKMSLRIGDVGNGWKGRVDEVVNRWTGSRTIGKVVIFWRRRVLLIGTSFFHRVGRNGKSTEKLFGICPNSTFAEGWRIRTHEERARARSTPRTRARTKAKAKAPHLLTAADMGHLELFQIYSSMIWRRYLP